MVIIRLIVKQTCFSKTQVGHSDPILLCGRGIDQRIKGTLGITGL